ncbi:hypothetical protein BDQ17DRAFT_233775 [Cyathus striatus]|nr:hypothetical protein BDQ17DRAFT_233775 [Cyathus striatus]
MILSLSSYRFMRTTPLMRAYHNPPPGAPGGLDPVRISCWKRFQLRGYMAFRIIYPPPRRNGWTNATGNVLCSLALAIFVVPLISPSVPTTIRKQDRRGEHAMRLTWTFPIPGADHSTFLAVEFEVPPSISNMVNINIKRCRCRCNAKNEVKDEGLDFRVMILRKPRI